MPTSYTNPRLGGLRLPADVKHATLWYRFMRRVFQCTIATYCQVRVFNRQVEPAEGGAVYICNHQSFLDPMLMSFALRRPMNYMARDSLFRFPVGPIIRSWNAFPVKRNTADTTALKEAMRRIKDNGQVVVFAEGTRTRDGRIAPLLPGVVMLAQRAARWTVPVVIDGALECWPRWQLLPLPGSIVVQYGQPLSQEQIRKCRPDELAGQLRRTMIAIQADIRRRAGRPPIQYDDQPIEKTPATKGT